MNPFTQMNILPGTLVEGIIYNPKPKSTQAQRGHRTRYIELFQLAKMHEKIMEPRLDDIEKKIHDTSLGIDCNIKRYPHGTRPFTKENIYDSLDHCHSKMEMWQDREQVKSLTKRMKKVVEWTVDEIRCFNQVVITVSDHIRKVLGDSDADGYLDDNLIAINCFYNHKTPRGEFRIPGIRMIQHDMGTSQYDQYQQQVETRKQQGTLIHIY